MSRSIVKHLARALLVCAFSMSGACLDVRPYTLAGMPHEDSYQIFVSTADDTLYFYLPLRVIPSHNADDSVKVSLVYSGYDAAKNSVASASLTATIVFATSPSELEEIRSFIEKASGRQASLSPLPALTYQVVLVTATQRSSGAMPTQADAGTLAPGSSIVVNVSLESLPATELFELFGKDRGRGGFIVSLPVEITTAPRTAILRTESIAQAVSAVGRWNASQGGESLTQKVGDALGLKSDAEVYLLGQWLVGKLGIPDIIPLDNGTLGAGWDLKSPQLQASIVQSPSLVLPVSGEKKIVRTYYAPLLFMDYCTTYKSRIVDLDSGETGCKKPPLAN